MAPKTRAKQLEEEYKKPIMEIIKEEFKKKPRSQDQLAVDLGMNAKTLHDILRDHGWRIVNKPSLERRAKE